jgi:hypothetical protein
LLGLLLALALCATTVISPSTLGNDTAAAKLYTEAVDPPATQTAEAPVVDPRLVKERQRECVARRVTAFGTGSGDLTAALDETPAPRPLGATLAVIVPLHEPKYSYGQTLVRTHAEQSVEDLDAWDLVLVFSSAKEASAFDAFVSVSRSAASPPLTYIPVVADTRSTTSPITLKKLYGVLLAYPCYDLLAVMDSEVNITDALGLTSAARTSASRGLIYAGREFDAALVDFSCCTTNSKEGACGGRAYYTNFALERLPAAMREAAARASVKCSLYPWFSDLPLFISADVPAFFADIHFPRELPINGEFDHLEYTLWKAARDEWRFVDLAAEAGWATGVRGMPEYNRDPELWSRLRAAVPPGPAWRPKLLCEGHPEACSIAAGCHAVYHLDRDAAKINFDTGGWVKGV